MIKLLYGLAISFIAYAAFFLSDGQIKKKTSNDIIGMVFGEARKTVSVFSMLRADLYLHGGVGHHHHHDGDGDDDDDDHDHDHHHDVDGDHDHHHDVDGDHDHHHDLKGDDDDCCDDDDDCCDDDDDHDAAHHHHDEAEETNQSLCRDWWHWANEAIHPHHPQHLQGAARKEVLPWMWLALKSDPHNIEAWDDTAFWMKQVKGDLAALDMISKGIKLNPESPELLFHRGRIYVRLKKKDVAQKDMEHAFAVLEKALAKKKLDIDGLTLHSNCAQWLYALNRDKKEYGQAIYYLKREITHPLMKKNPARILELKNRLKKLQLQQFEQLKK